MVLVLVIICLVFSALGYVAASDHRRRTGRSPWGWPPIVWAAIWLASLLVGVLLLTIATRTTPVPWLRRGVRWGLRLEAGLLVVLAVIGVWLTFYYRPGRNQAYPVKSDHEQIARVIHGLASSTFVSVALALVVLSIALSVSRADRRIRWAWVLGLAGVALALAMSFTGYLLPWDQLALRAVTVGTNYQGLWRASFDHGIQFVLIDGVEIGQRTLRTWFLVHAFALPGLTVLIASAAVHRSRRAKAQRTSPPRSEMGTELTTSHT